MRPHSSLSSKRRRRFQFTHPGRGATLPQASQGCRAEVSIHAPREGCDPWRSASDPCRRRFNSRTPGGVRPDRAAFHFVVVRFNSRTPGGVRRFANRQDQATKTFQFTHPGRGATRTQPHIDIEMRVSIHAPREGCDVHTPGDVDALCMFQFTHPGRGATRDKVRTGGDGEVSIHAPREGCD